jgi:hypothetical protein
MPVRELARPSARLKPLAIDRMPLDVPPPRTNRFVSKRIGSRYVGGRMRAWSKTKNFERR